MSELDVRIVKLEPMRVASAHALGESPEHDAIEKLIAWAKPKGLLEDPEKHRVFGFNNPDPSPGSRTWTSSTSIPFMFLTTCATMSSRCWMT